MTTHVMLDLETWGKGNDAVIVSLGAVKFDPNWSRHRTLLIDGNITAKRHLPDRIIDPFYTAIDPQSCVNLGLKMDADVVLWWMDEKQAVARSAYLDCERIDLASALDGFAEWFGDDKPVWGNGAMFDNVIITSAFKAIGRERPWSYKNDRCFRTTKNLVTNRLVETPPVGTTHNALDIALWQACHLQNISASFGINFS